MTLFKGAKLLNIKICDFIANSNVFLLDSWMFFVLQLYIYRTYRNFIQKLWSHNQTYNALLLFYFFAALVIFKYRNVSFTDRSTKSHPNPLYTRDSNTAPSVQWPILPISISWRSFKSLLNETFHLKGSDNSIPQPSQFHTWTIPTYLFEEVKTGTMLQTIK